MTIGEIREFMSLYQQGDETIDKRRAFVQKRRDKIERHLEELKGALDFITYKCRYYGTAAEAGTCDAPHNMSDDEIPAEIATIKRKCRISSR